ncbi:MAG TPA: hypothetical protein DIT13_04725 [Verrucomicrobiales bacterium]|nr:hypothetical protein [Verrucomicrobiales bacterium]HRJ09362.1 hypothetical protein [Prosthecobacter sp.]HRK15054.1 hypothetical protein [Prosthecobacter sp.]
MSNTIASELQLTTVLDSALVAFRRAILPLQQFATSYSNVPLRGDNTMAIPYYPLATSDSVTRASGGSYKALATSTTTQAKKVVINKNKVQAISFTSEERSRQPMFNPEMHGRLKGEKLAFDIIADIFSPVRHSVFTGATISATTAGNFDENDVADLAQKCMEDYWPEVGRSLILNPAFHFNLLKQGQIIDASKSADPLAFREATIRRILGFEELGTAGLPTNNGTAFAVLGEADDDTFTAAAHGLLDGDRVIFPTLTGGTGLTAATTAYFVRDAATNTFKVSATIGGAAVNFTSDVTAGTCRRYENIVGVAAVPSALLVGFAPVEPTPAVRSQLFDYRVVEDRYSGIVLEYKHIGYGDTDEEVQVIEAHYGDALGETAAMKLITTPLS